jgi:hypothetical protein
MQQQDRDKLIQEATRRAEKLCGPSATATQMNKAFYEQMEKLKAENWLAPRKGLPVSREEVMRFLLDHNILPTRSGKIVINCGPNSVGGIDFVSA